MGPRKTDKDKTDRIEKTDINENTTVPVGWLVATVVAMITVMGAEAGLVAKGVSWMASIDNRIARLEERNGIKPYADNIDRTPWKLLE